MGRTRKFTVDMYDTLASCVESEGYEWLWTYISWEIQEAFSDVDLTDEVDGYQKYLEGIVEVNDYTKEKLHTIFSNVKSIDVTYGNILTRVNEEVKDYTTIIKRLRESIGDVNFKENFSRDTFLATVAAEAQTMTMVRWREILKKDADDITEEEYMLLAAYLIKNGDEELLKEMLVACYDYKTVAEYQNGGYLVTTRVIYESPEKIEKLSEAMNGLMRVWSATQSLGYTGEEKQDEMFRAVQYGVLLQKLSQYKELSILSQQNTATGVRRVLTEELFEFDYDAKTGSIKATLCPYDEALSGSYCDYAIEKNNRLQISVTYPAIGSSAWAKLQDEAFTYINAYTGSGERAPEAMTKETISQFMSMAIGEIPGADAVQFVWGIVNAGASAEAEAHDTTVVNSEAIANMGLMCDTFQLVYVGTDTNGEIAQHEFSLYQSTETANWLEAFNRYMQSEEGEGAADYINYANLPGGGMTFEYIVKNPGEVAEMIMKIERNKDYNPAFFKGLSNDYGEIVDENREKEKNED